MKFLRAVLLVAACAVLAGVGGCASTVRVSPAAPSAAIDAGPQSPLGRLAAEARSGAAPDASALHVLADGEAALAARLTLADRAERSIDVQYYIFRADGSGRRVMGALRRAAERGVRVRLLLDDWGARLDDPALLALARHPAIEVRLFNPLADGGARWLGLLLDFDRANRRMHNKLMVVDGRAAVLGGRNVGDEYFAGRQGFEFADIDALAWGPVVSEAAAGFDRYWNDPLAMALVHDAPEPVAGIDPAGSAAVESAATADFSRRLAAGSLKRFTGRAAAVQDRPGKADPSLASAPGELGHEIAQVMGDVRTDLLIISPYFVPGAGGVEQLRALADRGVRVRVVTNTLAATDVPAVHAGYARYRSELLRAGVELYEIRADAARHRSPLGHAGSSRVSLHAKVIVVDRRASFIGSMNIDPRSMRLNTENGVVLHDTVMAVELADGVDRALAADAWRVEWVAGRLQWTGLQDGVPVTLTHEPLAGWWLRLQASVLTWLPIDDLL